MTGKTSILGGITLQDLAALYASERRPHIRKRLRALRFMLLGKSPEEAARLVKAGAVSAYRWLKVAREGGLEALAEDTRGAQPKLRASASEAARMREAIRLALRQHDDPTTRTRLMAVDSLVLGNSAQTVAREFKRAPNTVKHWWALFLREGLTALLGRPRRKAHAKGPTAVPSFRTLRVLAASERRPRIRHRLRIMALLASQSKTDGRGKSAEDDLVRMWNEVFPALLPKAPRRSKHGRDRRLNKEQQEMLRDLIFARPGISRRELCAFVEKRFGVTFSEHWMGQLVSRQLGLERVGGRFKVLDLAERGNGSEQAGAASADAAPRSRRLRRA